MMENSRSSLLRNIELDYKLLRFQLGVPSDTEITLTETLESLIEEINIESVLSQDFDLMPMSITSSLKVRSRYRSLP
jgi:hypothetical protein